MTLYQGPGTIEGSMYQGKFVRVGDQVAIGLDNNYKESHRDIADKDRLLDDLYTLSREAPVEIDAGLLVVLKGDGGERGRIEITLFSDSLNLPRTREARVRSGEIIRRLSPGYEIIVNTEGIGPSPEKR